MMRLRDDGPQRQVDLVRTVEFDAPTVARSITRLERAGFVRRRPHASDRRSVLVEATPASTSLRRAVERIWAELEARTVDAMSPEEQAATLGVLTGLERNLQAADRARADAG
jgi:MarR family transcriptional regulator, organic hydroperoxide resistance regulator